MSEIKCRIFRGEKVEEDGKIKFFLNGKIDKGYDHFCTEKEYKLEMEQFGTLLGYSYDAYRDDKIFASSYRNIKELTKEQAEAAKKAKEEKAKKDAEKKQALIAEYEKLSGEKAKGNWGIPALTKQIKKLKK